MTWHCQPCGTPNPPAQEHCSVCGQHWSKVWAKPKRRSGSRNRPKGRKEKVEKEPKESKQNAPTFAEGMLFSEKVPWINTTPQTRVPAREVTATPDSAPPPQPILPPPPPAPAAASGMDRGGPDPLTAEEQQLLRHLRGLRGLCALPAEMEQQCAQLEMKEKEQVQLKPLSHKHINTLHKLQNQVASAAKKVLALDQEWRAFVKTANENLRHHADMYNAYRLSLVEVHQQKALELAAAKIQVSQASATLVNDSTETDKLEEAPDMTKEFAQFQSIAQQAGENVALAINDSEEEEEEEDATMEPSKGAPSKKVHPTPSMSAFRGAPSPTKVANNQLKPKRTEKEKADRADKSKEVKEEDL
eukprot:Skav206382  [mRNA]  locus=scaffold834:447983:449059:- [translate_table: standard]